MVIAIVSLIYLTKTRNASNKQKKITSRNLFQISLLKEIGERIGYSLNVQNIVDIITGSIHQFMEYSTVSYMLIQPDGIIFKTTLEESISEDFIEDLESRMIASISALLNKDLSDVTVKKLTTGAVIRNDKKVSIQSFFNIPLIIRSNVVGVITVAHTKPDHFKDEETTLLYKITQTASNTVSRLETVIETEKTKMTTMVKSMADGILMLDNDYRILIANPSLKKIIGLAYKEHIDIFDIIETLGTTFDIRELIDNCISQKTSITSEEVEINDRFVKFTSSPVWSEPGETLRIIGTITVVNDITEEKKLEQMREDFTAMMVHELRAPLTSIKLTSEIIKDGTLVPGTSEFSEYTNSLLSTSTQILELVNDILDVSKMEKGSYKLNIVASDIRNIAKGSLASFEPNATAKKITLNLNIDPKIPADVLLDPKYLRESINNYLSNAIKFTKVGSVNLQMLLHEAGNNLENEAFVAGIKWFLKTTDQIRNLPNSIIVAVTDTGIGIPPEEFKLLFKKFSQVSTAQQSEQKGTGLGLAVVKGIASAHHGIVGIGSEINHGSTFYITFPLVQPEASETKQTADIPQLEDAK